MGHNQHSSGASSRHASRLVWALAFVGLSLGAFVLATLDLLLERTREQRDVAVSATQASARALNELDDELLNACAVLSRRLEGREPDAAAVDWGTRAAAVVGALDAPSGRKASVTSVRRLQHSVAALVEVDAEVAAWSAHCDQLASTEKRESHAGELIVTRARAPELQRSVERALAEVRAAEDGMRIATSDEMHSLVLQAEDDLERAQLRILVAATFGAAMFLGLAYFTWLAISRQIRAIEATNRELDLAIVEARAANRAKGEFLANMSHEIRTPMNGVLGMTNLLLETGLDASQRELAETTRSSAEALLDIINQILDFSKIEAGKLAVEAIEFSPRAVVEDVVELLAERAAQKDIELYASIDPDVPACAIGDPIRLRQVLFNLLGNAVKFTERGEVRVELRAGPRPWFEGGAVGLEFAVIDTGVGIPESARDKLFQPFTQADGSTTRRFGGTGLGLAISKQLIELFGGEITWTSETGRGTTFRFAIPLGRVQKSAVSETKRASLEGRRVWVVDDNPGYAAVLAEVLTRAGLRPTLVASTHEARVSLAAAGVSSLDVVLLDTSLPGDDATGFARELMQKPASQRPGVLLLSPRVRSSVVSSASREWNVPRLFKPVREAVLLESLDELGQGEPAPALPSVPAMKPMERRRAKVLLVEDNRVNQMVARRLLERMGHSVALAENGREAVERTALERFDVVLMDCQMPELDGYEATRAIRAREGDGSHTRIVAMTAHAMVGDREQCFAAGMDDYLTKPIKADLLEDAVQRSLEASGR